MEPRLVKGEKAHKAVFDQHPDECVDSLSASDTRSNRRQPPLYRKGPVSARRSQTGWTLQRLSPTSSSTSLSAWFKKRRRLPWQRSPPRRLPTRRQPAARSSRFEMRAARSGTPFTIPAPQSLHWWQTRPGDADSRRSQGLKPSLSRSRPSSPLPLTNFATLPPVSSRPAWMTASIV